MASVVDLHPDGFAQSQALGVANGRQVGAGFGAGTGWRSHALVWSGTPESVVDLHAFLPPDAAFSRAVAIDSDGDIVGDAVLASGGFQAVLWIPKPAPIPGDIDGNGIVNIANAILLLGIVL